MLPATIKNQIGFTLLESLISLALGTLVIVSSIHGFAKAKQFREAVKGSTPIEMLEDTLRQRLLLHTTEFFAGSTPKTCTPADLTDFKNHWDSFQIADPVTFELVTKNSRAIPNYNELLEECRKDLTFSTSNGTTANQLQFCVVISKKSDGQVDSNPVVARLNYSQMEVTQSKELTCSEFSTAKENFPTLYFSLHWYNSNLSNLIARTGLAARSLATTASQPVAQCPATLCAGIVTCPAATMAKKPIPIRTQSDLQAIKSGERYELKNDIHVDSTFQMIKDVDYLSGVVLHDIIINGNGHTIRGLRTPLIGIVTNSTIYNLNVADTRAPNGEAGFIFGGLYDGACMDNVHATNTFLRGRQLLSGLLHIMRGQSVLNRSSSHGVRLEQSQLTYDSGAMGTLVALINTAPGTQTNAHIIDSHGSGDVVGQKSRYSFRTGGLVGFISLDDASAKATLLRTSFKGRVTGGYFVGGLVGWADGIPAGVTEIRESFSDAVILAQHMNGGVAGGLVGGFGHGRIFDSFAVGELTANRDSGPGGVSGGLFTKAGNGSSIHVERSYANMKINSLGGTIRGFNAGYSGGATTTIVNSYWNTQTSGTSNGGSPGAIGRTTAQMTQLSLRNSTYVFWDISNFWQPCADGQYPTLQWTTCR